MDRTGRPGDHQTWTTWQANPRTFIDGWTCIDKAHGLYVRSWTSGSECPGRILLFSPGRFGRLGAIDARAAGLIGAGEPVLREAGPWMVDALAERGRRSPGQRPARLVATQTEVLAIRDQLVGISWTETGHSQTFRQKYELSVGWHSGAEAFQVPPAVHWIVAEPTNPIRQWNMTWSPKW